MGRTLRGNPASKIPRSRAAGWRGYLTDFRREGVKMPLWQGARTERARARC